MKKSKTFVAPKEGNLEPSGFVNDHKAEKDTDLVQALKALAGIPLEKLGSGKMTLAERPDEEIICAWNQHKLTVGDVKAARRALEALK